MILSTLTRPRAASAATGGAGGMDVDEGSLNNTTGEAGAVEAAVAARFDGFVASGTYVSVDVVGVPEAAAAAAARQQEQGLPLVAFALLRYENRTSVLHFNIQKYVRALHLHLSIRSIHIHSRPFLLYFIHITKLPPTAPESMTGTPRMSQSSSPRSGCSSTRASGRSRRGPSSRT